MSTEHAIVIGSGMGGMAAAIRLRARGYAVTLLEANDQLGGRAATYTSEGFRFDAGPTVVTAPYLFDELFRLVGRDPKDYYEMQPVDPYYRVKFDDGSSFDYVGDEERILSQIEKMSPDHAMNGAIVPPSPPGNIPRRAGEDCGTARLCSDVAGVFR